MRVSLKLRAANDLKLAGLADRSRSEWRLHPGAAVAHARVRRAACRAVGFELALRARFQSEFAACEAQLASLTLEDLSIAESS
jgi:hypothetical protein